MKKILALLAILIGFAADARAQQTEAQITQHLVGLGVESRGAAYLASLVTGGVSVQDNNVYLLARNAAGTGNISVLKVDGSDDTILNADTGDVIGLAIAGTTEVTVRNDELEFSATGTIDATTSIALAIGGTAEATLTNDQLAFSGAAAQIVPGATSLTFRNNADDADNLSIADAGTITFRGTLIGTGTSTLGWAVVTGANTACTTTCTTPCVFGFDNGAADAEALVGCADATADLCLCAGAT